MCDQPTPAMPEHASHPVAWSAVIAPCARPCLHICPPEVTARPSVAASSLACAQAFGNGPRRKAAAVGGERAIHGIAGESRSAPSELLAATMAATAARSKWRPGVRRKPQRWRWQYRRVHERSSRSERRACGVRRVCRGVLPRGRVAMKATANATGFAKSLSFQLA